MSHVIVGDFCIARDRFGVLHYGKIMSFSKLDGVVCAYLRAEPTTGPKAGWVTTCFVPASICRPLIRFRPEFAE